MFRKFAVAVFMCAVALNIGMGYAEDAEVKRVTAVAETLSEGQTIVGVRIEYPGRVLASDINLSTYRVGGFDIIATYVNDDGVWDNAETQGRYVFLKFAAPQVPGYTAGKTLMYFDKANRRMKTRLDIKQNKHITLDNENIVRPDAFGNDDEINLLVDDFREVSFTDSTGFEVKYRLFIPKGYESAGSDRKPIPLVMFLHGDGEGGIGNDVQIMGNPSALEFAKPEAQAKNPCFVMAPQTVTFAHTGGGWATNKGTAEKPAFTGTNSLNAAIEAVHDLVGRYNIDTSRLYCTGLSGGSRGSLIANIMHPDLFAAMLNMASADIYTEEQAKKIVKKPMWMILSADENDERLTSTAKIVNQLEAHGAKVTRRLGSKAWNGYLRGYAANLDALEQWDASKKENASVLFTHLIPGTVQPNAHWSWVYTYNNEAMRDWLFSHTNPVPYKK